MEVTPPLPYDSVRDFFFHGLPQATYEALQSTEGVSLTAMHPVYIAWAEAKFGPLSMHHLGAMRFYRQLGENVDVVIKFARNGVRMMRAGHRLGEFRHGKASDPFMSSDLATARPSGKRALSYEFQRFLAEMEDCHAEVVAGGIRGGRLYAAFQGWQMAQTPPMKAYLESAFGVMLRDRTDLFTSETKTTWRTWAETRFVPGPNFHELRSGAVHPSPSSPTTPAVDLRPADVSNFVQVFAKAKLLGRGNKYPLAIPAVVCHCARHPMPTDILPFMCFGLALAVVVLGWWGWKQWTVARPLAIKYANLLDLSNQRAEELTAARQARDGFKAELEAAQREVAGLRETMGEMDHARDLAPTAELVKHYQTELIPGIVAERDQWHDWYLRTQEQMGAMQQKLQAHLERAVLFFAQTAGRYPAVEDMLAQARAALAPKPGSAEEKAVGALEKALREWEGKRKRWPTLESAQRLIAESEQSRVSLQRAATVPAGKLIAGPDGAPASFTPAPVPDVRRA